MEVFDLFHGSGSRVHDPMRMLRREAHHQGTHGPMTGPNSQPKG